MRIRFLIMSGFETAQVALREPPLLHRNADIAIFWTDNNDIEGSVVVRIQHDARKNYSTRVGASKKAEVNVCLVFLLYLFRLFEQGIFLLRKDCISSYGGIRYRAYIFGNIFRKFCLRSYDSILRVAFLRDPFVRKGCSNLEIVPFKYSTHARAFATAETISREPGECKGYFDLKIILKKVSADVNFFTERN